MGISGIGGTFAILSSSSWNRASPVVSSWRLYGPHCQERCAPWHLRYHGTPFRAYPQHPVHHVQSGSVHILHRPVVLAMRVKHRRGRLGPKVAVARSAPGHGESFHLVVVSHPLP